MNEGLSPVARIRAIFDGARMRQGAILGATDGDVARCKGEQNVARIPATVEAIWRLVGLAPGPWGSPIGALDAEAKESAREALGTGESELREPRGMLVIRVRGDSYEAVDGSDLHLDDPPVWRIEEGAPTPRQSWPSVVAWFEWLAQHVEAHRQFIEETVANGGMSTDEWYYERPQRGDWKSRRARVPSPNGARELLVTSRTHAKNDLSMATFVVRDRTGQPTFWDQAAFEGTLCWDHVRWTSDDGFQAYWEDEVHVWRCDAEGRGRLQEA